VKKFPACYATLTLRIRVYNNPPLKPNLEPHEPISHPHILSIYDKHSHNAPIEDLYTPPPLQLVASFQFFRLKFCMSFTYLYTYYIPRPSLNEESIKNGIAIRTSNNFNLTVAFTVNTTSEFHLSNEGCFTCEQISIY